MSYIPNGGGGGALVTNVDLDLSILTPATYAGDGAKTIGGKTWYLKNSVNGRDFALNDGVHAGLYWRCTTTASYDNNGTYNCPRFTVGLRDLCSIEERDLQEIWAMVLFSQPHTPNANYEEAEVGISTMPGAESDTAHLVPVTQMLRAFNGVVLCDSVYFPGAVSMPAAGTPPATTDDVYAFRIVLGDEIESYSGASVGGNFPALSALKYVSRARYSSNQGMNTTPGILAASFQWAINMNCVSGNGLGAADILIKRIKVLSR